MTSEPWEGFNAWRSGDLLSLPLVQVRGASGNPLFSGQLSTWASVYLEVIPTGNACVVELNWFDDPQLTQSVTTDSWPVTNQTGLKVILPVKASYATLTIASVNPPGGGVAATWFFAGINNSVGRFFYPISEQTLDAESQTLTASASALFVFPMILHGVGYLSFNPHDATAKLALSTVLLNTAGNVVSTLARFGTPAAVANVVAGVPDGLFAVQVTNTDASASHSFDLSAVAIQTG